MASSWRRGHRQTENRFVYCYGNTGERQREARVSCNKSGDLHSKSGDREIFIILSKIRRSPAKSGDLEALPEANKKSRFLVE